VEVVVVVTVVAAIVLLVVVVVVVAAEAAAVAAAAEAVVTAAAMVLVMSLAQALRGLHPSITSQHVLTILFLVLKTAFFMLGLYSFWRFPQCMVQTLGIDESKSV
jgi:hypothetical protein